MTQREQDYVCAMAALGHGETEFTVPMFDAYVRRAILSLEAKAAKPKVAKKATRKKAADHARVNNAIVSVISHRA